LKSIKEGGKTCFQQQLRTQLSKPTSKQKMSYQTAPMSPNPYITQKLNNMDEAKALKKERRDWMRMHHKMLKEIKAMIDVQRQIKDIMKMAEEANMMIAEMEGSILEASINN